MSFQLVHQLQQKAVPVVQTCRVLEVSRSGRPLQISAARRRSQVVPVVVRAASVELKAAFAASGGAYGSRRLRTAVASRGVVMGIYRVRRLVCDQDAPARAALNVETQAHPHHRQ